MAKQKKAKKPGRVAKAKSVAAVQAPQLAGTQTTPPVPQRHRAPQPPARGHEAAPQAAGTGATPPTHPQDQPPEPPRPREFGHDDTSPPIQIHIGAELKASAKALAGIWSGVEVDEVHQHDLTSLALKFSSSQNAEAALIAARQFINTVFSSFDRQIHPLRANATGDSFELRWEYFLPAIFLVLADDIGQTVLPSLRVSETMLNAARMCLAVFEGHEFIRPWLPADPDSPASLEKEACFNQIQKTQTSLHTFLRQLIESAAAHHVCIDADLRISVDGRPFHFDPA